MFISLCWYNWIWLDPIRCCWFTLARLFQCWTGWTVNNLTGFTSGASSARAHCLKLPSVTSAYVQFGRCATTPTSIQASLGSAISQRSWAVMPGSATTREDSKVTWRPTRISSFKCEGAERQDGCFVSVINAYIRCYQCISLVEVVCDYRQLRLNLKRIKRFKDNTNQTIESC